MERCSQRKDGYLRASVKGRFPFCLPEDQASSNRCSVGRFHSGHFPLDHGPPFDVFHSFSRNVNVLGTQIPTYLGRLLIKDTALLLGLFLPLRPWGQICICCRGRTGRAWLHPACITCFPCRSVSSCRRCTGGRWMREPWRRPSSSMCSTSRSSTSKFSSSTSK